MARFVRVLIAVGAAIVILGGFATPARADCPCDCDYVIGSSWVNADGTHGFVANISITNPAGTPVQGWSSTWNFPASTTIILWWNTALVQNGTSVIASNADFNAAIAPGAKVTFGFRATSVAAPGPAPITVNGQPCP
jgi:cellulase/cellobiase CelA1